VKEMTILSEKAPENIKYHGLKKITTKKVHGID
jgi:hypothetical protein